MNLPPRRGTSGRLVPVLGLLAFGVAPPAWADFDPDQVLVVYNAASATGGTLKDAYLAAQPGIPASNVLALNDASLLAADISYADFVTKIRDPIRAFLNAPGYPDASDIVAIVLIRPIPHRIRDTDNASVGDQPNNAANELLAGDATFASVDAELVLLWQNLNTGEAGGTMDSKSDNMIDNPYHQSTAGIHTFSRNNITTAKTFNNLSNVAWGLGGTGATRLTPGDVYLVCRIDGNVLADALALVQRGTNLVVNRARVRVLLDEYDVSGGADLDDDPLFSMNDPFLAGDDFEEATAVLQSGGWDVRYDGTFDFIDCTEETNTLIGYSSYGENHSAGGHGENPPGAGTYISCFDFARGAMFNTFESYNGRALNGLGTLFNQEQVADFVAAGGTFAIGNVYEPFTFSVADNEYMMPNLLMRGMRWGEAAYTSLPCLSWQQIVIGDPLARPIIVHDPNPLPGDMNGDGSVDGEDVEAFLVMVYQGAAAYNALYPDLDPIARGDFDGDLFVTDADRPALVAALLNP